MPGMLIGPYFFWYGFDPTNHSHRNRAKLSRAPSISSERISWMSLPREAGLAGMNHFPTILNSWIHFHTLVQNIYFCGIVVVGE